VTLAQLKDLCSIIFSPASLGIACPRTGMVCQPEASACMLWGSHMNNNNGYRIKIVMQCADVDQRLSVSQSGTLQSLGASSPI